MRKKETIYNKQYTDNGQSSSCVTGLPDYSSILSLGLFGLFSLFMLLSLPGCTSDELEKTDSPGETTILKIPVTRSPGVENELSTLRMIIFSNRGKCLVNTTEPKNGSTFEEEVPVGYLNLYLIANERASWNLDNVASIQELKSKPVFFTNYPAVDDSNPIPMFGAHENIYAAIDMTTIVDEQNEGDGTVERLYAKVTLNLDCTFSSPGVNTKIILDSVRIKRMPGESYLSPERYSDNTFFDGQKIIPGTTHGYDPSDNTSFNTSIDFYIPEYIINDKSKYTYLSIFVHKDGAPANTQEYTLVIGDGIGTHSISEMKGNSVTLDDLRVSRNTHYTFQATITGFTTAEMDLIASVDPWGSAPVNTIIDGQYYLTLSRDSVSAGVAAFTTTLDIKTNYNRTDLGYNDGIYITDTDKLPTGVTISGGTDGDMQRSITITGASILPSATLDGYFTISAGNLSYKLRIDRSH